MPKQSETCPHATRATANDHPSGSLQREQRAAQVCQKTRTWQEAWHPTPANPRKAKQRRRPSRRRPLLTHTAYMLAPLSEARLGAFSTFSGSSALAVDTLT